AARGRWGAPGPWRERSHGRTGTRAEDGAFRDVLAPITPASAAPSSRGTIPAGRRPRTHGGPGERALSSGLELQLFLAAAEAAADPTWKEQAIRWVAEYSYVGVFLFLLACGLGFPSPEEVALIGAG